MFGLTRSSAAGWTFALVCTLLVISPLRDAAAVNVNYGDCFDALNGDIVYEQVTENTVNPAEYAAPTCVGDGMDFDPSFNATANDGSGTDTAEGGLTFTIRANPGFVLSGAIFSEDGDYTLIGLDPSSEVAVDMDVTVTIIETVGGVASEAGADNPTFSFSGIGVNALWALDAPFSFDTILLNAGFNPLDRAIAVDVTIDNILTATTFGTDDGTIFKRSVGGLSITAAAEPIPEPTTGLLLGLGISGLALARRRSQAA